MAQASSNPSAPSGAASVPKMSSVAGGGVGGKIEPPPPLSRLFRPVDWLAFVLVSIIVRGK